MFLRSTKSVNFDLFINRDAYCLHVDKRPYCFIKL